MTLYEVKVGATYWVVAKNIKDALTAFWTCCEDEGSLEDAVTGDGLSVESVPEGRARKIKIRDDEHGRERSAWDMSRDVGETAEVIACSEW